MVSTDENLSETDIRGPGSHHRIVRASRRDRRQWLQEAPVCAGLIQHRVAHVGVAEIRPPFRIVRTNLEGSYFLACFGGQGRVLVDGRWKPCRPGWAFLLPPGTLHAFESVVGEGWDFCWVRYEEPGARKPVAAAGSPVLARFDAEPLRHAILGLHRECRTRTAPAAVEVWVDLVHRYVSRFARPAEMDPRLWQLWEAVAADLSQPWRTTGMARAAHMSEKHLERLCKRELGRTPRQQLIWLRMRRAAELLTRTRNTVEAIAAEVGYQNPFVFSRTFKRFMGWSPSRYPGRR